MAVRRKPPWVQRLAGLALLSWTQQAEAQGLTTIYSWIPGGRAIFLVSQKGATAEEVGLSPQWAYRREHQSKT